MMSVDKQQNHSREESEVSKFYNGKSIFITGAAGYLGVVLLETLLRCCPGIKRIFILLRSKNNMNAEDRKEEIFKREIFFKLRETSSDFMEKVIAVSGDIVQENLGMNDKDLEKIIQEVSIVFHCAASISFFRSLDFIMNHNVIGTDNVIDLCHKLRRLEALVYTSTLYSNSNRKDEIDEKIYKLHFKAEEAVNLLRKCDVEGLNRLYSSCNPPFQNFYTFSKCVAENLLDDKAWNLPVCIVRPSVITCCFKGPMPGYMEKGFLLVSIGLGIGKGFIRVARIYDRMNFEFVTADVAANTHIIAAYLQATKRLPSPSVYNCTSDVVISWQEWFHALLKMVQKYPVPNSYLLPNVILCKNPLAYKAYSFFYHYLPAFPIDILLWIIGSDFRFVKTYRFYDRTMEAVKPFITGEWVFHCNNFYSLPEKLNETDAEMFCVDMKDFTVEKVGETLRLGCPFYRIGNKTYEDSLWNALLRYFLTYLIRFCILGSIVSIFYMILF